MPMKNGLRKFVALPTLCASLMACTPATTLVATATEREICIAWGESLPSRSREDTQQTREEIGEAYDTQAAVCVEWAAYPRR